MAWESTNILYRKKVWHKELGDKKPSSRHLSTYLNSFNGWKSATFSDEHLLHHKQTKPSSVFLLNFYHVFTTCLFFYYTKLWPLILLCLCVRLVRLFVKNNRCGTNLTNFSQYYSEYNQIKTTDNQIRRKPSK